MVVVDILIAAVVRNTSHGITLGATHRAICRLGRPRALLAHIVTVVASFSVA
jgi:hypothetical protein